MAARITPRLIELTYEAALKSFWRKQTLRSFLRSCQVHEPVIASWATEESKRDFLDQAFNTLQATDRGKTAIFDMARHLSEQSSFPDLRDWDFPGSASDRGQIQSRLLLPSVECLLHGLKSRLPHGALASTPNPSLSGSAHRRHIWRLMP